MSDLAKTITVFLSGLEIGEPWKLDERKGGMIVPLLRQSAGHGLRGYVVLEEVKDEVMIRDLGSINKVKMKSSCDKPVFVRGGGVLKGQSTQSRGIQFGVVILPDQEQAVPVLCVHASRGIVSGDIFTQYGYAPSIVAQAMQSEGQIATWRRVSKWTKHATPNRLGATSEAIRVLGADSSLFIFARSTSCESDNLVRAMDRFKDEVDEALRKVPGDLTDQVGIAILSEGNVVGIEAFDDPASWLALSRSVIRQYKDVLDKEDSGSWSVDQIELVQKIKLFLEHAKESEAEEAYRNDASRTLLFRGKRVVGECTLLCDKPIHFVLTSVVESDHVGDHDQ